MTEFPDDFGALADVVIAEAGPLGRRLYEIITASMTPSVLGYASTLQALAGMVAMVAETGERHHHFPAEALEEFFMKSLSMFREQYKEQGFDR